MNLTKDNLDSYLVGSLNWSGVVATSQEWVHCLPVYHSILSRGLYHLPFFLVSDLRLLLAQGYDVRFRSESFTDRSMLDEASLAYDPRLIMRYERECLGRNLQANEVHHAIEIASTAVNPTSVQDRLLFHLLNRLSPHFPSSFQLNPGLLRGYQLPNPSNRTTIEVDQMEASIETFLHHISYC